MTATAVESMVKLPSTAAHMLFADRTGIRPSPQQVRKLVDSVVPG